MWDQFHGLWQTGYASLISKRRSTAQRRAPVRNRGVMPPPLSRLGGTPMGAPRAPERPVS